MLCIGCDRPGAFEGEEARVVRLLACALASALHDWLTQRLGLSLRHDARLQATDLQLLQMEWHGLSSQVASAPARAVEGCLVLLCFAAPNWRAIPQCVPPIRQVLLDLARGRAFPTCGMAGAGNSAAHAWASAPGNCPPQYTRVPVKR